jgi:osmotically-inducible protein OsmY
MMHIQRTDEDIKKDIVDELYWDDRVDASDVMVEVEGGRVALQGSVPSYTVRRIVENTVVTIRGVTGLDNHLVVELPRTLHEITDIEIKANVTSSLGWHPDINATDVGVTVTAGIVSLDGSVGRYWEKLEVEEVISKIGGVVGVENRLAVVPTRDVWDQVVAEGIVMALERSKRLDAGSVTVEVKSGRVVLSGTVPDTSTRRVAEDIAFRTSGVREVEDNLAVQFDVPTSP